MLQFRGATRSCFLPALTFVFVFSLPSLQLSAQESAAAPSSPDAEAPKIYNVGRDVSPPKVTYQVEASFSEKARKKKITARCTLALVVTRDGGVRDIEVLHSAAENQPAKLKAAAATLDDQAIAAVRQWRFAPATLHGQPVAVRINVDVNFQMY